VVAIGDSSNDAQAARAAGCPVLTVPYGYNHGESIHDTDSDGIVATLLEAAHLFACKTDQHTDPHHIVTRFSSKNTTSTKPARLRPGLATLAILASKPSRVIAGSRAILRLATDRFFDNPPPLCIVHTCPLAAWRNMTELEFKSLATGATTASPDRGSLRRSGNPADAVPETGPDPERGKNTFLLESVVGGERFGRYSFIGLPATRAARSGNRTEIVKNGAVIETHEGNPLDFIENTSALQSRHPPGMPRFCGGLAGYFGYDTVRHIEKSWPAARRKTTWACPTSS
jgi:hypothetical protein